MQDALLSRIMVGNELHALPCGERRLDPNLPLFILIPGVIAHVGGDRCYSKCPKAAPHRHPQYTVRLKLSEVGYNTARLWPSKQQGAQEHKQPVSDLLSNVFCT